LSDHKTALVPLESWCYSSPELRASGKSVDVGLLAEALVYYDSALINVSNQPQFAELLRWFIVQNKYNDFLALVNDGVIKIYDYAFVSTAVLNKGVYSLLNIQDEAQAKPNTFEQRFLYHNDIQACLNNARLREKLYKTLRGNVVEVKAGEFGNAIENARKDYDNSERNALVVQAFVDELYSFRNLGPSPVIEANLRISDDGNQKHITYNVDFNVLSDKAGKELNFHLATPLTAGAISNRLLWSAANLKCDLFLGKPISVLIGDKLYETSEIISKSHKIVEELQEKVEFPDLRQLVNSGKLGLDEILKIRKKSQRFRSWLQEESDRDRDAIIAYHHEVAKASGFTKVGRKTLNLFGVVGGGAAGSMVGSAISGPVGAALGGASGSAIGYLLDIASKLGADWRPMVFGNWYKDRIEKVLDKK